MNQQTFWIATGVLLVSAGIYAALRAYRVLLKRLAHEQRRAQRMSELHLATIEALALAVEAKDQTSPNHLRRAQAYAGGLARALGIGEDELQAVKTAALLHDVGKLAVSEYILAKPGALTPEEVKQVRIHAQVGAEILAGVPFAYPVAPLVRSHHERWDGRGYPDGLRGEDIPRGARILSVVDYFEELTSDRPYHKAMSVDAATNVLQQEAGNALDPHVVSVFLRILPELRVQAERDVTAAPKLSVSPEIGTPSVESNDASRASVFEDVALTHREIYALYQIAQTMGTSLGVSDTMALIASKLANLVPLSACALFLSTESNDMLHCRFATGADSELIQQLAFRNGQGLTGWVARNRRPLVNARPSADLEAAGSNLPTTLQSALICPLVVGERFIGTLAVYHTAPAFYRDDHRRLLERVCAQASAVINNAIVFEQTQEASLTDQLTGLPNTRFMVMHLTSELARAKRLSSEIALLVMDLNEFKEINDTYGHHIGDRALRAVAQVLRSTLRPYDTCVRYAGDEFIVVLADCGREKAEHKRIELQQAVDRINFEPHAGLRLPLAISAGAAVFPHDGDTYELLLARADAQMYRDKSIRKRDGRQLNVGQVAANVSRL